MFTLQYNNAAYYPIVNTNHASMRFPTRAKLFSNNILSAPRSIGVDGVMSYGGGTGIGLDLSRKAFGEYFERNHFFTSVPIIAKRKLSDLASIELSEKLKKCISQIKFQQPDVDKHIFNFTRVYNLLDNRPAEYIYNAVSLDGLKEDGPFYNFNDSCSCAVHTSREKVLKSSLMEFLERQALLGSWMTKKYHQAINPDLLREVTPYSELIDLFLKNGELYIFENGLNLPGYSTIMFYFSHSRDDLVQYSVGSSAGLTLTESLNGSFEELWQCYLFQYNAENSKGLEDRAGTGYHLSFQQCNNAGIRNIIPFVNDPDATQYDIATLDHLKEQKAYSLDEVISALGDITNQIYYYYHYEKAFGMHFSKIVSPDFFIHMALEQPLNLINAYSETLGITPENAYLEKIPFP